MKDPLILPCPHCDHSMMIYPTEINCAIFRHAVFKSNMEPIPPHSTKDTCQDLLKTNQVYGCAGPFRLIIDQSGKYIAEKCDYL